MDMILTDNETRVDLLNNEAIAAGIVAVLLRDREAVGGIMRSERERVGPTLRLPFR